MAETVLEAERLVRGFGALRATDDVSLTLKRGEIHALIGPNGAGKSTLLKLLAGEALRAEEGRVLFEGEDVTAEDPVERARRGLARSFQISAVFPEFSLLRNATLACVGRDGGAFGLLRAVRRDTGVTGRARAALARAGLDGETRRAADLSHGERRRLEIAMALAQAPRAFLLDEPMAGLGAEGSAELTALLDGLRTEAPILLVEHDMDAVFALADRVTVLNAGRVIAAGTAAEVRADAEVRRAYLGEEA